jgi:hypothetical protein
VQFVQLVLTDDQALLVRFALDQIINDPERFVMEDEERADYERLAVFFGTAAAEPSRFPPTGAQASRVKSIVRRAKGPAQQLSRAKKRSQGQQKRDRKARREMVEAYNAAFERMEAERAEMEQLQTELEARIENQPKFRVLTAGGQVLLDGVPAEFVVNAETGETLAPKIIVPGA